MLALLAIVCAAAPSAADAADPGGTLGVYPGHEGPSKVASFEQRLGRGVSRGHEYLDKTTWSSMLDVRWMAERWTGAGFGKRMVITVPMLPDTLASGYGPLASGANGEFNSYFRTIAQRLVQYGLGSSVLRIGPEFNGGWFKWTMNVPGGDADYAAYWRQIVNTVRAVPGASFKFDWAPNAGSAWIGGGKQLEAADGWPGDDYVDYVGLDVYDQSWAPHRADPVARWNEYVNQHNGMAWQAAFAAARGKPLTYPEWGLADRSDGYGGGDNPYFIEKMHEWIASHNVAYHLYFEASDPNAQYGVFSGNFPRAAQTFINLFGPNAGRASSSSFDFAEFARLSIDRARISPRAQRLKLLATIARRASGATRVELSAGGRKTRFSTKISGGRVKVSRRLSRKQARRGTGVVTLSYRGNGTTKAQRMRLIVGPRKARLRIGSSPRLVGNRLQAFGTINRRARGVVRLQLKYEIAARTVTRQYNAKIRKGRWRLNAGLSQLVRDEIAQRRGPLHAYALYTGSLRQRIGGQMKPFQLLGAR